jgi:TPR repeat protein
MLFGAGEEAIHITGLTEGSRLSAGEKLGSTDWQILPRDLAGVLVVPPASFIGTMRTVIQLRSAGNVPVDTQTARYQWVAKLTDREAPPQPKANDVSQLVAPVGKLNSQRSAQLVKRGVELLRIGDFAAARLVLRPAAEGGDLEAALLLGATFDPAAVSDLGALGLVPDPNMARAWYQRAMDAGSVEASRRIERLARTAK